MFAFIRSFLILFLFISSTVTFLFAQSTGSISGRVVSTDGKPARDADVTLIELHRKTHVDSAGDFGFEGVPPGQYLVQVESPRSGQSVQTVMVRVGETSQLKIALDRVIHTEEIVVSANTEARSLAEVYQPVDVLSGTDLSLKMQPTLGETLSQQAGVNSTYFGPGASRPIIRGLGGDRIRMLIDGVGAGDASSTSPDHSVSTDPLSAERIEVVRGPATLLYGSSAVGGVVNVLDSRIPDYLSDEMISGSLQANFGSVANERSGAGSLNGKLGRFGWHADLMKRETDDYNIPGFAEEHYGEEEPGHEEEEEVFGVLTNSALETDSAAGGLSYIADDGFIGASYSGYNSLYGIPGHGHAHEEEGGEHTEEEEPPAEEESVKIDLQQRRFDVRGEVTRPFGFMRGLKLRVGRTDYEHAELEGEAVGTLFTNDTWETRIEGLHKQIGSLNGSFGVQIATRDFTAIGEEAFLPPTQTDSWALFAFEEIGSGKIKLQLGARYEKQDVTAQTDGINNRGLDGLSGSVGVLYLPNEDYSLSASLARSVKLPNAEELFSNGPHIATNAFEIGDPNLSEESSLGLDISLRKLTGRFTGEFSFFTNRFNDFIFEQFTDEVEDGLQVFRYVQTDARFTGLEFHGDVELFHIEPHHIHFEIMGDYVRADDIDLDEPLPRIPPMRVGAGVVYQGDKLWGRVDVRYVSEQDRVATFEEPTASYTMLNASIGYRLFAGATMHDIILRGTNLTDEEARNHVSFLKEIAPLPGRDISIIYKLSF
jgi:iron complex outermembrane receptor protein